ncbi:HAD hydrolase-like protein, partial [Escherichia coli]|nr:HAD hydrolase-like protein [Escherichia coli]
MQCKGFLFDLDGTLVDSLPVVERSWCKWADRFSIPHDEVLNFIHGKQAITSLRHFLP